VVDVVATVTEAALSECRAGATARAAVTPGAVVTDQAAVPMVRPISPARAAQECHRRIDTGARVCPTCFGGPEGAPPVRSGRDR
jgi:hypothetical protein